MIVAAFDGSCDPNPGGICTYGFVVRRDGALLHQGRGLAAPRGPGATNNVAEYTGCLRALEWLDAQGLREGVVLRGDSELVVRQLSGIYRVKSALLAPLHAAASALMPKFPGLRVEWIPRARNAEADRLSKPA
jgi:ribonuclease HI